MCVISQIVQVRIVVSGSRFPSVSVIITHTWHKEQQWFLPGKEWNLSTYFYHTIRLCTRVVILTFSGTLKMIFSGTKHKQENRFLHTLVYFQWRPKHLLSFDIFSSRHSSGTAGFFFFLQGAVFTVFPFVWSIYFLVKTSSENKAWNNVLVPQWLTNRSFIFLEKKQPVVAGTAWWKEGSQTTYQCRWSFFWNHDTVQSLLHNDKLVGVACLPDELQVGFCSLSPPWKVGIVALPKRITLSRWWKPSKNSIRNLERT